MAITAEDIQPVAGAPAAPVTPPAPEAAEPTVPDEVLQIPAFNAMLQGKPPAVFTPKGVSTPETQAIERNIQPLMKMGFGVYRPLDDSGAVFFNQAFVDAKQLKAADKAGKLDEIAPPIQEVLQAFGGAPAPEGEAAPQVAPPAGVAPSAPNPALNRARVTNLTPGGPTSGAAPGQGRILNNILKPAV